MATKVSTHVEPRNDSLGWLVDNHPSGPQKVEVLEAGVFVIDGLRLDARGYAAGEQSIEQFPVGIQRTEDDYILKTFTVTTAAQVEYPEWEEEVTEMTYSSFPAYPLWLRTAANGDYELDPDTPTPQTITGDHTLSRTQDAGDALREEQKQVIKAMNIAMWKHRLKVVAEKFDSANQSQKWAHEAARGGLPDPQVCLDLDADNDDHLPEIRRADNISVHWPKVIGIAWRAVSIYEEPNYGSMWGADNEGVALWAEGRLYVEGDVVRTSGSVAFVALRTHTSAAGDEPDSMTGTWEIDKLQGVPASVNLSTGEGFEDLIAEVERDFGVNVRHRTFHHSIGDWRRYAEAREVRTAGDAYAANDPIYKCPPPARGVADWNDLYLVQYPAALEHLA